VITLDYLMNLVRRIKTMVSEKDAIEIMFGNRKCELIPFSCTLCSL
jgi:hypothetical protein